MLEPGKYYHIYNHANGFEDVFRQDRNYSYFLEKYKLYISPIADTYCYCLMPNHFHLLIKIKEYDEIEKVMSVTPTLVKKDNHIEFLSKQFARFLSCYTQSYNRIYRRMGSLFIPRFKRKVVDNDDYRYNLVYYIHNNPVHHGFVKNMNQWIYSSYLDIISGRDKIVNVKEILEWFDNRENFIYCHQNPQEASFTPKLMAE